VHKGTRATFIPRSAVEARRKHRQSTSRCENIRQTDGYRLMSRRSHDRNVSGEYNHSVALQKLLSGEPTVPL